MAILKTLFLFSPASLMSSKSDTNTRKLRELEMQTPTAESKKNPAAEPPAAAPPVAEVSIDKLKDANMNLQKLISNRVRMTQEFTHLYFVFQGIVFASIMSSSTQLKCKMKGILFTLSLLVSIFNFFAVLENISASLIYYEEMTKNWEQIDKIRGPPTDPDNGPARKPYEHKIKRCRVIFYLTLLLLLVFTVVILYGCYQVECDVVKKD
ncbi:hypothetical protein BT93_L0840 [Corymbia citriodora subsp. variegata]|uniref:Uncharacterized protein n=1 Tax=Corymbia citriodora subsp. variegata TaxID=360336 RepID=A0A8T0CP31_CORYI|nr:hypothetical protein BT93_L0840 [Corymbia citriodora subsp. variegata]